MIRKQEGFPGNIIPISERLKLKISDDGCEDCSQLFLEGVTLSFFRKETFPS